MCFPNWGIGIPPLSSHGEYQKGRRKRTTTTHRRAARFPGGFSRRFRSFPHEYLALYSMRGRFVTLLLLCAWCFSFSNFFLKDSNSNTHTHSFSLSLFLVWWGFSLSLFLSFFCNSPFLSFVRVSFCSFLSRVERERRKRERERDIFFPFFSRFFIGGLLLCGSKKERVERERERE